jgi:hypothetical protein
MATCKDQTQLLARLALKLRFGSAFPEGRCAGLHRMAESSSLAGAAFACIPFLSRSRNVQIALANTGGKNHFDGNVNTDAPPPPIEIRGFQREEN